LSSNRRYGEMTAFDRRPFHHFGKPPGGTSPGRLGSAASRLLQHRRKIKPSI
jgi:hypothetical protein